MSERKTTEIKLRVSPDEKTSWQLAAEQSEVGLSQFIRDCVEESIRLHRLDGLMVSLSIPGPKSEDSSVAQDVPTSGEADRVTRTAQPQIQRGSHQVGTKPLSALRQPKPWTFEARKSG